MSDAAILDICLTGLVVVVALLVLKYTLFRDFK
jgi:hypothetical protein